MDLKQQILECATEKFMSVGIRSISMDDISNHLGISKKTLYKYVENKRDLVDQTISRHLIVGKELMNQLKENSINAVDEMIQMGRHNISVFRSTKPVLLHDLQKYYRQSWEKVVNLQSDFIQQRIYENLHRGIQEGLYRADINPKIIAKLYVAKTWSIVDESVFPLYVFDREDLIKQHLTYHIHGIVTERGMQYLNKADIFNT